MRIQGKKRISIKVVLLLAFICFTTTQVLAETGDVNTDGSINIVDALLIAQYYVGLTPSPFDPASADTNGDGSINIVDALLVAQYYVGLITEFPVGTSEPTPEVTPTPMVEPTPTPAPTPEPIPTPAPGETSAPSDESRIGIIWASWDPYHYQDWSNYVNKVDAYNMKWVSIVPTYFIDTYAEGVLTSWQGAQKVPDANTQKSIIKEFLNRGFSINYRPHMDPIKYAMPYGEERDNWSSDPGGRDWRGKFDRFNPTDSGIGYKDIVIMPSLQTLAEALQEMGTANINPVRFDIGAELMDSMLNYPEAWIQLQSDVKSAIASQYSDVADKIIVGYNFCHHLEYLRRLPNHDDYLARIHPEGIIDPESQYLDRPGVTASTRNLIGQFIAGLDEFSISQYMPFDIYSTGGSENTTPEQVRDALLYHEQNFINESLIAECGMSASDIPPLHVGEYGMGIRGLIAPNVWNRAAWDEAGTANLLLSDDVQKLHAETAIKGLILYVDDPRSVMNSLLIWLGGKPYDVLGLNDYSEGWYNAGAAQALEDYWNTHN